MTGSGASEEFVLTSAKGVVTRFFGFDEAIETPGRLKSITDRYGSTQTYNWAHTSGLDQLTSVTDSYGRTVTYRYYGSESGHRLQEIEDFLGRKLNFQYNERGHLVAVVTPSIEKGASGNTFPGGTGYVFQYDVENPRIERREDLIKIWYPNQVAPFLDTATRTIDVERVYADATPRYLVEYGQDPTDGNTWGRVTAETVGDPLEGVGGTYRFAYATTGLTSSIFAGSQNAIVFRTTVTDRNENEVVYEFSAAKMPVRVEQKRNRQKISIPPFAEFPSYVTWTEYNVHNQPLTVIHPEGNSTENTYSDGTVAGLSGLYPPRVGLLETTTERPDNDYEILSRPGSSGQSRLTRRFFYDPIFNQPCAVIERRGNPIDASGNYFTPQNGGTTPTDADRSRYATITYFDYQKNQTATVTGDAALQALLGLNATQIGALVTHVDNQLKATDGTGGIPAGFPMNLGDINGDGTGNGASSGLPAAKILGNVVKVKHPSVRLIGSTSITTQVREEIFTTNDRGQVTTHTDAEGNLTVYTRYPFSDPEGDGRFIAPGVSNKQYGNVREIHVDADPNDVLSLVGADGDLVDFIPGKITRTNTPGVYQKLVTRYEGASAGKSGGGCGCSGCGAYDALGNPLAVTDPRGFTTRYERNELGQVYRTIAPQPYSFKTETYYDANRNVVRIDTEDQQVAFESEDPTSADYAKFIPSGSGSTAHVPMKPGPGGSVRAGWFTNLLSYNLLDNRIEEDVDATGSNPSSLVTTYEYDPNENLIKLTKPAGNTVEYDYEERNLRIAERVGNAPDAPAITITAYDGNGNLIEVVGPAQRGASGNWRTVTLEDAFRSADPLTHTGDFVLEIFYDGFDRVVTTIDAVGNVVSFEGIAASSAIEPGLDPDGRVILSMTEGPVGGATPTDRNGLTNQKLSESVMRYDEAGRQYEAQQNVFLAATTALPSGRAVTHTGGGLAANSTANNHTGTVTLTSGGLSYVLSRTVFDRSGRSTQAIQDNTAATSFTYDGANRKIGEVDALNNQIDYTIDAGGNVVLVTRTEKCTITSPTVADEIFRSSMAYDALGRLVLSANQGADGNLSTDLASSSLISLFGYDSRGNQTLVIDPKFNTTITVYDGAIRALQTQQHLREQGQGENPPEANESFLPGGGASIVTTMTLDGNGRMTQLVDDRGNPTRFAYDTLDRETVITFQDGSTRERTYNMAGDVVAYTDENGSVFANTSDPLGRKTAVSISLASGVVGTNAQSFQFDGLSRKTFARDSISSTHADVNLRYDSLRRTLEESQAFGGNTRNVTNQGFASHPVVTFTFPHGRQTTSTYDVLYRRTLVEETSGGADIASWKFFGPNRVAELTLGNGLIQTFMNNARTHSAVQSTLSNPSWGNQSSDRLGYDGPGRPITKRYLTGGINGSTFAYNTTSAVLGFTSEHDKASIKLYERALHAENHSHLYQPYDSDNEPTGGYDSLNRLRQYQRGTLSSTGGPGNLGGGSISSAITLTNTNKSAQYELDGLGNWRRFIADPVGGGAVTQIRQHNGLNEITRTTVSSTNTDFVYDGTSGASNGNLANDGTLKYEWDALNRLVKVYKTPSSPVLVGTYTYDAMNRRIRMVVSNGGLSGTVPNGTTDCVYEGWRCVEERDGSNNPTKQYIWGIYFDELIQQKNITALNNFSTNAVLYPLQDLLYRTMALADSSGTIREAYDYDAYGNTLVFRNSGSPPSVITWTNSDTQVIVPTCPFLFTGQRHDAETRNYYYKMRYYAPNSGVFLSRDPIGFAARDSNLYRYVSNSPVNSVDPSGLIKYKLGTCVEISSDCERKYCDFDCTCPAGYTSTFGTTHRLPNRECDSKPTLSCFRLDKWEVVCAAGAAVGELCWRCIKSGGRVVCRAGGSVIIIIKLPDDPLGIGGPSA